MPVAQGAQCAQHPSVQAVEVCSRCGAFVCAECLQFRETEVLCPGCYERFMGKASTRAVVSLVLSVAGISCMFVPLGVAGMVLGMQELDAIKRGESPEAGKSIAQGGLWIGVVNTALLAIGVLILVGLFLSKGRF